ncbi:dienelactone hydrolase family protein [Moheibacter sediminis]|nr:dienelactone hydrolase family protein [Moheibacter sediminis]
MKNLTTIFLMFFMTQMTFAQNLKPIAYKDGNQKLNGLITDNTKGKKPGVLILPAWKGIDNEAKTAALELEKQGYIAMIADIYGEGHIPKDNTEAAKISSQYKTDYEAYQKRISIALDELKKSGANADKIAVIGYCFGGTGALETARANFPVQGVVSIHGGLGKGNRPDGKLSTKILIIHPADDKSVSEEDIKNVQNEMKNAKADWQMIYYANSGHTFTNPESTDYNEIMAKRSWEHVLMFLNEILK